MTIFRACSDPLDLVLLVLPESSMLSLAATLDPLRAANRMSNRVLFRWRIVTLDGNPAVLTCGVSIPGEHPLEEVDGADAVIVVAGFNHSRHAGPKAVRGLRRLAQRSAAVGGIEAGSWLLARAGLLDGQRATTHWEDLEDFALTFPNITVSHDRFVISGRYFTAGGASPSMDMILQLIRSRHGLPLALQVASAFVYEEVHAASDRQPQVSLGRLGRLEPRVSLAIAIMEENLDTPVDIPAVAERIGLSGRHLQALFKRELEIGPGRYYLQLRLQAATRLLVDTNQSMQNIAVRTGFTSQAVFARAFRRHFGVSPKDFRHRDRYPQLK